MAADLALVLTTFPIDGDVDAVAEALVAERLAACVNLLAPMQSVYRWKGSIERSGERQLLIKTTAARLPALQQRLKQLHPYEVPEIVVVPITGGSDAYLEWIRESCR